MPNIKQTINAHSNKILEKQKQQNKTSSKTTTAKKETFSSKKKLSGEQMNITIATVESAKNFKRLFK